MIASSTSEENSEMADEIARLRLVVEAAWEVADLAYHTGWQDRAIRLRSALRDLLAALDGEQR